MTFVLHLTNRYEDTSVKELLEKHLLIPRKIRHFLRIDKKVRINGKEINWQSSVPIGATIDIQFDDDYYPQKSLLPGNPNLIQVLYEDDHLIIVNKPEGMKTHANLPDEIALLNHVSSYVGHPCYVVHRLDMETSGAILFAKNQIILPILNRLLEDKKIFRTYWALVQGQFKQKKIIYKQAIGRDRHDRRKRLVDFQNGQSAITTVTRLKQLKQTSLLKCQLKTGRTHQIRVHLSHNGFPIVGDPLYNPKKGNRLMLHAYELSLQHPFTLETITVRANSKTFEKELRN